MATAEIPTIHGAGANDVSQKVESGKPREGDAPAEPLRLPVDGNHARLGRCIILAGLNWVTYRISPVFECDEPLLSCVGSLHYPP